MIKAYLLSDSKAIVGGPLEMFLETIDTKESLTDSREILETGEGFIVIQGANEPKRYTFDKVKGSCNYYSLDN